MPLRPRRQRADADADAPRCRAAMPPFLMPPLCLLTLLLRALPARARRRYAYAAAIDKAAALCRLLAMLISSPLMRYMRAQRFAACHAARDRWISRRHDDALRAACAAPLAASGYTLQICTAFAPLFHAECCCCSFIDMMLLMPVRR